MVIYMQDIVYKAKNCFIYSIKGLAPKNFNTYVYKNTKGDENNA